MNQEGESDGWIIHLCGLFSRLEILRILFDLANLPVIVGFGGVNPAGRSSSHLGYRRLVYDALAADEQVAVVRDLLVLSRTIQRSDQGWVDRQGEPLDPAAAIERYRGDMLSHTLVRRLENGRVDPDAIPCHRSLGGRNGVESVRFELARRQVPEPLPSGWTIEGEDGDRVRVRAAGSRLFLEETRPSRVNVAGQLPTGFDPSALYQSRNHPRALQLSIFGASDAVASLGVDWEVIASRVAPDRIGVFAGSAIAQLDPEGFGGLLQSRLQGRRPTSKHLPLGLAEMPADFVNAYVLQSLGPTGHCMGACATFLYNLKMGLDAIQRGDCRLVLVGGAEAAVVPEVIDGFDAMGALGDDDKLRAIQGDNGEPAETVDHRRACRPFGNNAGLCVAEGSQWVFLADDALALELGLTVHGAVGGVFVHADGPKKSISGPGAGNYVTVARALAEARAVVGDAVTQSYVHAHGTGTPQNRVTESHILSLASRAFGLADWPVVAIKAQLGHSMGPAGGDQLMAALGFWSRGILPGIVSTPALADDVHRDGLDFVLQHREVDPKSMDVVFLNAKGFGG